MLERDDLYKDVVKHLRVVRNVSKTHKEALGVTEIQPDAMTPYERGRMTRSCIRLGRNLEDLIQDPSQVKIVFAFMTYMDGIGVKGSMFSKPGLGYWSSLWRQCEEFILDDTVKHSDFESMISHVGNMLDQSQASVPGRVMLLKLAV